MDIRARVDKSVAVKLAAFEKDKEVSRLFVYLIKNELHKKPYALIEDVFVEKEFRRAGLATSLLKKALKIAKEMGCYKVVATSRTARRIVHEFYLKNGFKKHGLEFRINL